MQKAAEFWRCSVFELLNQPEGCVDLAIAYMNADSQGRLEFDKRNR